MEYITLGKIVKTIGLKGEVKILSSSDFSFERYKKNNEIYLFNERTKERKLVHVKNFRKDQQFDIVSFQEFANIDEASTYVNTLVQVTKESATLPNGYYHYSDLVECNIYDEEHNLLGTVKKVEQFASYQTLRVSRASEKDFFVPFVKQFIKKVDLDNKSIIIHVLEGLL